MRFKVVLEPGEDGWIVAECPILPGCVSQGRTEAEAVNNILEAIELWLETEVEKRLESLPPNAKMLELLFDGIASRHFGRGGNSRFRASGLETRPAERKPRFNGQAGCQCQSFRSVTQGIG